MAAIVLIVAVDLLWEVHMAELVHLVNPAVLMVLEAPEDLVDLVELEVQVDQEVLHCQAHPVEVLAAAAAAEVSPAVLVVPVQAVAAMMVFQEWEHQDSQVDPWVQED